MVDGFKLVSEFINLAKSLELNEEEIKTRLSKVDDRFRVNKFVKIIFHLLKSCLLFYIVQNHDQDKIENL